MCILGPKYQLIALDLHLLSSFQHLGNGQCALSHNETIYLRSRLLPAKILKREQLLIAEGIQLTVASEFEYSNSFGVRLLVRATSRMKFMF